MTTVAGVDIGSNTLRLVIARVDRAERLSLVDAARQMTRLGDGMGREAVLRPAAIDRSMSVLREFRRRIAIHAPDVITVVATSAVREAANRTEFIERVRSETGMIVEVLSGQEEARRTLLGAWWGLRNAGLRGLSSCLLFDIGGGSTEYVLGRDVAVEGWASTPLGVVRLTERFLHHDPVLAGELKQLRAYIDVELDQATDQIGPLPSECHVAGTAGTVTTIGALFRGLDRYDPAVVNGTRLSTAVVDEWVEMFIGMTAARRQEVSVLKGGRAELIIAGGVVLQSSLRRWRLDGLHVSDWGLKEGIILDAVRRRGTSESLHA
ncbi:MAG TPA: Ppx/GppA phosphatase family protein [Nitrospiria bacterium]|nr:Ppx/GppA phosphatase family protein [Nitrospiria bacterium]